MKKSLRYIGILALIVCGLLIFAACSSGTTEDTGETVADTTEVGVTRLVNYTDEHVKGALDEFDQDAKDLGTKVSEATSADAKDVKKDVDQLKANVDAFDAELTKAAEDSKITEDVKKGYDESITSLKDEVDKLETDIDAKMSS